MKLLETRTTLLLAILLTAPALLAQTPAAPPADAKPDATPAASPVKPPAGGWAFEVATIKPAKMPSQSDMLNGKAHVGMKTDAARVDIGFMSLKDLIGLAYKVKDYQISGPSWIGGLDERFDILAKMPDGAGKDDVPAMLQALLAERFKLAIHRDTKERPVYALVVGKGGSKMKETPPDPPAPAATEKSDAAPGEPAEAPAADAAPQFKIQKSADGMSGTATMHGPDGNMKMSYSAAGMHMELEKMTMDKLAEAVSRFVDRPVVDSTELKGNYQVALDISMEDLMNVARKAGVAVPSAPPASGDAAVPSDPASDPSGSVFASVAKLGLKLEPRKVALDQIMVDHMEKMPTEN